MDSPERKATKTTKPEKRKFGVMFSGMMRKLVSRIVEKLAKYLAGSDCVQDAVGHMLDEDVG